jgi:endonuclease/exonuclease/phosphatase family metal-dependent hydrolase
MKLTAWNIKHAGRLIDDASDDTLERLGRVRATLQDIDPDIICLTEGPKGAAGIKEFAGKVLDDAWVPVLLEGIDSEREYRLKGGQWIWFLVKPHLRERVRLQHPDVWRAFVGEGASWKVHRWGQKTSSTHQHYRHPQVLLYELDGGKTLEFVGLHLKSKINKKTIRWVDGDLVGEYVDVALDARMKIATEAMDVRAYIDAKFEQVAHPAIVLCGDLNDGPGKDWFEQRYLFSDLLTNLQGEVLVSERFFNHALFDYPDHLSWTAKFDDDIADKKARDNPLLLDHILMSQPLTRGHYEWSVEAGAGLVEHEAFERHNAGSRFKTVSSDHRPVSLTFTRQT